MTPDDTLPAPPAAHPAALPPSLRPLLAAECAAEAAGHGVEPADLEQAVWLRWLERGRAGGPPSRPEHWLRAAVRAEVRAARRRARREVPYDPVTSAPGGGPAPGAGDGAGDTDSAESRVLRAERRRILRAAVGRLPGRCPAVLAALLSDRDPTYPEVARELGISQGSLGPMRSRCIDCLRRMLTTEVAPPGLGGRVR
ncbi:MAG TPA: sigma-70 family RNA polymerase sigma factor [Streptomyces sp.]|uniref:sigma-70 family RNA polymerase sigma factor n=1 Tax=Streptomyces sp. TaxID=1931 RepID=UPI002D45D6A8|nr:sigma-70 family RNA polymerase sigma factor [Streptomyces sp.]HZG03128.1 sigma-70 family RNA polymerase sigma factor [Streptomyces sp.]